MVKRAVIAVTANPRAIQLYTRRMNSVWTIARSLSKTVLLSIAIPLQNDSLLVSN